MNKKYVIPQTEILALQLFSLMIPASYPEDPSPAPRRLWRPGPGANYSPPAKIV